MIIKICGISNLNTAIQTLYLGADMIGLMFAENSSRKVTVKKAKYIRNIISDLTKVTAVFQDQPLSFVNKVIKEVNPDYIQLHGHETPQYCSAISVPIIKAIKISSSVNKTKIIFKRYKAHCHYFLVDRQAQGKGPLVDLCQVQTLSKVYKIIVAGGITPQNISQVLDQAGPSIIGIDVSSGVENKNGEKSIHKITNIINKVRRKYA